MKRYNLYLNCKFYGTGPITYICELIDDYLLTFGKETVFRVEEAD